MLKREVRDKKVVGEFKIGKKESVKLTQKKEGTYVTGIKVGCR